MDHLDFLDIVAILLGISFTVAKLDAQSRKATNFPHVVAADFERWQDWTVSIYRWGSSLCFLRVVFHQGWSLYMARHPMNAPAAPRALVLPAMAMDALFFGVLASTFIRASRARARRRELGIVLTPLTAAQAAAIAPENESEAAAAPKDD